MFRGILHGHCQTTSSGMLATPSVLDWLMWTTITILHAYPRSLSAGSKTFYIQAKLIMVSASICSPLNAVLLFFNFLCDDKSSLPCICRSDDLLPMGLSFELLYDLLHWSKHQASVAEHVLVTLSTTYNSPFVTSLIFILLYWNRWKGP